MKINWNLLIISVIIAAVGSGLIYAVMAIRTQGLFPISLSIIVSILFFVGLAVGSYLMGIELKSRRDIVSTEKQKIKLPKILVIFPIIWVISYSLAWLKVGGLEMTNYGWWMVAIFGFLTFCILLYAIHLQEKSRKK